MRRNTIIFLLTYFFCNTCFPQQYPFIQYTPKDGLVSNRARFMFQDSKGLLYISTFGGLSIYDGSRFTNYTMSNGLSTNLVNDIVEMGDDSLWIIPNEPRIQCFVKGKIKDLHTSDGFYPSINKMMKRNNGSYYALADEGLFQYEKNHFKKIKLVDDNGTDAGGFFVTAMEIKNKVFIITDQYIQTIGGPSRLIVYDSSTNKVAINKSLLFYFIIQSPQGDILVSTNEGIKKIDENALQQNKIQLVNPPSIYRGAEKFLSTYMYFDQQQNLWLCTLQGVCKIDKFGQVNLFTTENGLPVNIQTSVFQDKENIMWFTNEQTGISKLTNLHFEYYPQIKPGFFTSDIYTNSHTDSVWFMNTSPNKILLQYGNTSKEFLLGPNSLKPPFKRFAINENENYITDLFNIYQCDLSDKKKARFITRYTDTTKNHNLAFSCVMPDGHGNLITSSENITVVLQNKKTICYPLGYLSDEFVITPDNLLWTITREKKLFQFRIHPDDPDHYLELLKIYDKELPAISPRSITVDKNGNLWIGTRDNGLLCLFFDGLTLRSWKQVTIQDGLSDNFISYLHTDEDNTIWACSPVGLDKIQLKDGKISIENITLSNNIYLHIVKIQTTKQGVHWVMTESGVIKITPDKTISSDFQPKIILREINESKNKIDQSAGLSYFSYKKNNISFSLAVPSFIDEKQTRFSYVLEGSSNKSWSEPSDQAVINFVNLAPGKYKLKAKAMFVNHRYPDSEISYSFIIHPPWWQTWWFRLGLAFCMTILLSLLIRNYYQRKYHRQRMILEKQQAVEKERTRIATDMHDDLGAGLSTIRFLSEKVKRNTFSQVTRDDIEKMQSASNELIDKMNEIIWSMNEKNDSLEDLIFYTRSYAMEYCEDNNIICTMRLPENIPAFFVSGEIRRNVFLTVKESLHNIVKHACAKNVDIVIETAESLDIAIKDDGIGLQENHKTSGGNGFRNMRKRIESIGGDMAIQNGNGMTIILKVPLS